jgi:hypothetical protein
MTLLIPRLASWRYARGQRTLLIQTNTTTAEAVAAAGADTTTAAIIATPTTDTAADTAAGAEAEVELCDPQANLSADATARQYYSVVASLIDFLLLALQDGDTVVRWSAAKGLGRIAMRLPLLMGNDVVTAVISESFGQNCTTTTVDGKTVM